MDSSSLKIHNCTIIILAAGSSSRMGKPKQLLLYKGKTLLQNAVDIAVASGVGRVIVVLGANASLIRNEVNFDAVNIVQNDAWQEGMASSIHCGINALQQINAQATAALFMVCDQPYITAGLLQDLLAQLSLGPLIVASKYANDALGIPAIFHTSLFSVLLTLTGDTGAKKIMNQCREQVKTIPFPLGNIDMDTLQDYKNLVGND